MAIQTFDRYFLPVLRALSDGNVRSMREIRDSVATETGVTKEDLAVRTPGGKSLLYSGRVGWAKTYLNKAGLIDRVSRGRYVISQRGREALGSGLDIDLEYLCRYPEFNVFIGQSDCGGTAVPPQMPASTPDDLLESALRDINNRLEDELLERISAMTPSAFESLVVDVLGRIYGGEFVRNTEVTGRTGDEGIDGIIKQDRLGFNNIYVQAKLWNKEVPRPEVQKFAGALQGQNAAYGAFITSSDFTKGARDFADKVNQTAHIVLVDGRDLVRLMIEYDIGVVTRETIRLKGVDSGYFDSE